MSASSCKNVLAINANKLDKCESVGGSWLRFVSSLHHCECVRFSAQYSGFTLKPECFSVVSNFSCDSLPDAAAMQSSKSSTYINFFWCTVMYWKLLALL